MKNVGRGREREIINRMSINNNRHSRDIVFCLIISVISVSPFALLKRGVNNSNGEISQRL